MQGVVDIGYCGSGVYKESSTRVSVEGVLVLKELGDAHVSLSIRVGCGE